MSGNGFESFAAVRIIRDDGVNHNIQFPIVPAAR
jgi:hypothetical protein